MTVPGGSDSETEGEARSERPEASESPDDDTLPAPETSPQEQEEGEKSTREFERQVENDRREYRKSMQWGTLRLLQAQLADIRQDRVERKRYAARIFGLLAFWLITVLLILSLSGLQWSASRLRLHLTFGQATLLFLPGIISGIYLSARRFPFDSVKRVWSDGKAEADDESDEQSVGSEADMVKVAVSGLQEDSDHENVPRRVAKFLFTVTALASPFILAFAVYPDWMVRAASFKLSDSVLRVLLATTTVNVIGLFGVVVYYLFPQRQNSQFRDVHERLRDWIQGLMENR